MIVNMTANSGRTLYNVIPALYNNEKSMHLLFSIQVERLILIRTTLKWCARSCHSFYHGSDISNHTLGLCKTQEIPQEKALGSKNNIITILILYVGGCHMLLYKVTNCTLQIYCTLQIILYEHSPSLFRFSFLCCEDNKTSSLWLSVCIAPWDRLASLQSVLPPHTQCSQDRLHIPHVPEQDKAVTEDE